MSLLAISDLHLGPSDQDRIRSFLKFLEQALQQNHEVLIAGDLFSLWFGWPRLFYDWQIPIVERMKTLAASGLKIDYVEGNRDLGIAESIRGVFRKTASSYLRTEWNGARIHVEHGDLINRSDIPYRVWRRVSKNPLSFFLLRHLPPSAIRRIGSKLETEMQKTNRKHKVFFPEEHCRRYYTQRFEEGADIVIVGHFHCEKEIAMRIQEREVLFYSLPGWEQGFRFLVIPGGNKKPYFQELSDGNLAAT